MNNLNGCSKQGSQFFELTKFQNPDNFQVFFICFKVTFSFYRPQRSWGKAIFSEACVKNSVHRPRGGIPACLAGNPPPEADTPPGAAPFPQEQTAAPRNRHPPPCAVHAEDTVNKRVVRILLECNLVSKLSLQPFSYLFQQYRWWCCIVPTQR